VEKGRAKTADTLSVVVPIFNEEKNIRALVERVEGVLNGIGSSFEVILVDDGSSDGSGPLMDEMAREHGWIRPVHLAGNYGQSSALHAGFRAARGEVIVTLDGDLQYDPGDIPEMLRRLEGCDAVCGWRESRADSPWKRFQSRFANAVRNALSGETILDTGCALKVIRKRALDSIRAFDGMHRFIPTLLRMEGFRVIEVPVRHYPRKYGESKYGAWNRMFQAFYDLLGVRWMKNRRFRYRETAKPQPDSDWPEQPMYRGSRDKGSIEP
jgi:dolichol-phosphate mannosyltransferase